MLTSPLTAQTSVAQVAQWIADSEDPERTDKERVAVLGELLAAMNEWRARAELGEGEKRTLQNAVECLYYQGAVDDAEALAWLDFALQNSFTLFAAPVPASQPGLFYFGPLQIEGPFGDGNRCVGGSIHRLPVVFSDVTGVLQHSLDFTGAASAITPFTVWNFQAWFRDPAAGGSSFNLSDGLEILFLP